MWLRLFHPTSALFSKMDVMLPFENSVVETLQPGVVLFQLHRGFDDVSSLGSSLRSLGAEKKVELCTHQLILQERMEIT